jgi:hypothetical protein
VVAPVTLASGATAVLKASVPHMEGEHEIKGLRLWSGDPTVRLLASDDGFGAPCSSNAASRGRRYARCRNPSRMS